MSELPGQEKDAHSSQREPEDLGAWDANDEDELVLDPKYLLIVKDGTIRVAESLDDMQRDSKTGEGAKAFGTWTRAEHERFLKAMETYPKGPWKAIAEMVGTRTVRQTQTHAQKYREKMARRMRGLRNRNGTLQSPPTMAGVGSSGGQLAMYPTAPSMPPPPPAHADIAALAAIASSAPLLQAPLMSAHYYPRTVPPRRLSLPLPGAMNASMALGSSAFQHPQYQQQQQQQQQLDVSVQASPQLLRSASGFDELSQSSILSAFLGSACYPSTWEAYGTASEGKEEVPDFDESMDFLMDVYSSDPNQIGANCVVNPLSSRSEAEMGGLPPPLPSPLPLPLPSPLSSPLSSTATAPFSRGDEHLRRRTRTE